jgi:selenocysteine lyase/cysteine desulfurase
VGTQPEALKLALGEALAFHHGIGGERKEARLRYLRDYWAKPIAKLPRVRILTPFDPKQSCGIGTFTVDGMDMGKLSAHLFDSYKIVTTSMGVPAPDGTPDAGVIGIRVTPSIYTLPRELDIFIEAVTGYVKEGLPG